LPFDDILRGLQRCVNPPPPDASTSVAYSRQLKVKWFPVSIEREVDKQTFLLQISAERNAMRSIAPIWLVKPYTMPASDPIDRRQPHLRTLKDCLAAYQSEWSGQNGRRCILARNPIFSAIFLLISTISLGRNESL